MDLHIVNFIHWPVSVGFPAAVDVYIIGVSHFLTTAEEAAFVSVLDTGQDDALHEIDSQKIC